MCLEGWLLCFSSCQQASRAWGGDQMPQGAHARMGQQPLPQGPAGHHMGVSAHVAAHGPRKQSCALATVLPTPRVPATSRAEWRTLPSAAAGDRVGGREGALPGPLPT